MPRHSFRTAQKFIETNVQMERTHLNAWRTFYERTKQVPQEMRRLLKRKDLGKEDVYSAFRALNASCFEAKSLRDEIAKKYHTTVNKRRHCDL